MSGRLRTNFANTGRAFQHELELTFASYARLGIARIQKVDPPMRILGGGRTAKQVIHLANPFLDYIGTWTERGGRTIVLEAKSTTERRLPIARHGGLTAKQWEAMLLWARAGAVSCLIWHVQGEARVFAAGNIAAALQGGRKSLSPEDGGRVGVTNLPGALWDVLAVLRANPTA